ncbi:hypothetical protein [Skermania sp. ID1734]|uniref:DUF7144 family membrane protein n=1 Tax=Skermania sp. ID1734 TaxID=2597516 RepID=UPI00351ABD0A
MEFSGRQGGSAAESVVAASGVIAAAIVLVAVGAIQVLEGISALAADAIIVVGPSYVYQWNLTGWGIVHVVLGGLLILLGAALTTGAVWAKVGAITLAALSLIANFAWLPYAPWWSVLIIALDAFAIWAITTWHPHRWQGRSPTAMPGRQETATPAASVASPPSATDRPGGAQ